jgi:hypothetical protein
MRFFYTMRAAIRLKVSNLDIPLFRYPVFVSPFLVVGVSDFMNFIHVCNNAISKAMLSCFILFYLFPA